MNDLVKLCIDTAKNCVANYSSAQGSETIKNAFIDILGTDKPDYRTFRKHKNDIFEIIEVALDVLIVDGWGNNPFFNQFVEYRDLNLGDTNEFYVEDKTILTVSKIAKGNLDLRRQKLDVGDTFTVKTDTYGISIYTDFLRFLAGRIDWNKFVAQVAIAFDEKIKNEIYTNFKGVITYLPTAFKATGTFDAAKLETICGHVEAATGQQVTIAGTKTAMASVYGTNDITWSDEMKSEYYKTGKLGYWRGRPLFNIPQVHTANTFTFALDDTQLFVLPANVKPIKLVNEGTAIIKEVSDGLTNVDMSMEYTLIKNFGIATIFNVLFGMYDM